MLFNDPFEKPPKLQGKWQLYEAFHLLLMVVAICLIFMNILLAGAVHNDPDSSISFYWIMAIFGWIIFGYAVVPAYFKNRELGIYRSAKADHLLEQFSKSSEKVKAIISDDIKEHGHFTAIGYWACVSQIETEKNIQARKAEREEKQKVEDNRIKALSEKYPGFVSTEND